MRLKSMAMGVTPAQMLAKLEQLDPYQEAAQAMEQTTAEAEVLQRAQLKRGLGQDGKPLSPKYSEDPWFKSAESARRYALWKQKLNPEAPFDTPDLYINGATHNAIFARVTGKVFQINTTVPWAGDLERKYRGAQFGLNEESKDKYKLVFMPIARRSIKEKTGMQ